ncbi:PhzF family phenazine biosynthesis protein [Nakamurella leprariae]|uniref:PhzF family phenazine biosynthesis protein n=1 Tax=Nakamurella leprariae TaxID=2803911 RepID=A0A939C1G1_9ACTN|nr:PhzF family phenazine biosynthesis protein [Nakamurella leprariae]MBM9467124.1 PhzF family phenazine biosynthesis protein [Nakamurella leprariae]
MGVPVYLVDAFADGAFTGNPAGVVPTAEPLPESLMAAIAMELHQAETAFVSPLADGTVSLRWFTPTVEVDLCGHATLAAAHVLREHPQAGWAFDRDEIKFATRSGVLIARPDGDVLELDFPDEAPEPAELPGPLPFPGGAVWTGRNRMDWFVQLADEAQVRALAPDPAAVAALGLRGLVVTAVADRGGPADFVSRCFYPQTGVPEDPVTGSAHCGLAPFWADRLGRTELVGFQASRRGGTVAVRLAVDRVRLGGRAVTTVRGELLLPD